MLWWRGSLSRNILLADGPWVSTGTGYTLFWLRAFSTGRLSYTRCKASYKCPAHSMHLLASSSHVSFIRKLENLSLLAMELYTHSRPSMNPHVCYHSSTVAFENTESSLHSTYA